jgi:hypothetical protein
MGWLIHRWSASRMWGDLQMLALAGGALIAHTAFGAIALVQSALDRAGLVVLALLTVCLLLALMRRVAPRPPRGSSRLGANRLDRRA